MTDVIADGREAWQRLRDERATWEDWLAVGRALVIGRSVCLKIANTNRPLGMRYNRAMGQWLRDNGLDAITGQERHSLVKVMENLPAIEQWREALPPEQRRKHNHPALYWIWRRATAPDRRSAPSPRARVSAAAEAARKGGRQVYWSQDAMKRVHRAMLDSRSHDLQTLARVALQAAIRDEADLIALLEPTPPTTTKSAPAAALALSAA